MRCDEKIRRLDLSNVLMNVLSKKQLKTRLNEKLIRSYLMKNLRFDENSFDVKKSETYIQWKKGKYQISFISF